MNHRLKFTIATLVLTLTLLATQAQAQTAANTTNNRSAAAGTDSAAQADAATPAVVTKLNNLSGNVTLAAGANTKITRTGNTITIGESVSGLKTVAHDATLKGNGTPASPLSVAAQVPASQPFKISKEFILPFQQDCFLITNVPAGKRLFIEYASVAADLPEGQQLTSLQLAVDAVGFELLPVHTSDDTTVEGPRSNFRAGQQTPLFANGPVQMCVARNNFPGSANFRISISGYLVNLK